MFFSRDGKLDDNEKNVSFFLWKFTVIENYILNKSEFSKFKNSKIGTLNKIFELIEKKEQEIISDINFRNCKIIGNNNLSLWNKNYFQNRESRIREFYEIVTDLRKFRNSLVHIEEESKRITKLFETSIMKKILINNRNLQLYFENEYSAPIESVVNDEENTNIFNNYIEEILSDKHTKFDFIKFICKKSKSISSSEEELGKNIGINWSYYLGHINILSFFTTLLEDIFIIFYSEEIKFIKK